MATRHGYEVLQWLVERGWKEAPLDKSRGFVCGDRHAIDSLTNKEMGVYDAAKLQQSRTGEYPDFLKER